MRLTTIWMAKVYSILSFPIDEESLEREGHHPPAQEVIGSHKPPSQSIPPACRAVIEFLAAIWVRVLHPSPGKTDQYPTIGQDEVFSDLGGDSISAAEVASLCMGAGFDLTLQDIIDFPTLRLQTLLISGLIDRPARIRQNCTFHPVPSLLYDIFHIGKLLENSVRSVRS